MSNKTNRRKMLGTGLAVAAAAVTPSVAKAAEQAGQESLLERRQASGETPVVQRGRLLRRAGLHFRASARTTKATSRQHTKTVLDQIQKNLESVGSSMEKVLKVNVYLNDLKDYAGMNEVFMGRFGAEPPVRTTIAAAGGIPGDSLVEIDCIATL